MPNFKPIVQWPGRRTPHNARKRGPFGVQYGRILKDLDRELEHLRATSIVIQAEVEEADIRLDGHLRSSAKLRGPGVILSFNCAHGPLSFACDTYTDWQQNLRAISMTLNALRAVDRYGATKHAEQYKGWKQLPEGGGVTTVSQAAAMIVTMGGGDPLRIVNDAAYYRDAYRRAAKYAHPDHGGDNESFARLQHAKSVLDVYHANAGGGR